MVGTFIDFIVFQIDESGVAEFRDETYFIHVCLLQLFKVSRAIVLSFLMLTWFSVTLCLLDLLDALMSFIAYAHSAFHHRMNLNLGLLVSFLLGIVTLDVSTIGSVSRSTTVIMLLELIGFNCTNWGYKFVSDSW